MAKKRPGRPKGSKNKPRQHTSQVAVRCPACGSTRRGPYRGHPITIEQGGTAPDGRPYTHVVKRYTHCLDCPQHYVVTTYEYHPKATEQAPVSNKQ